MTISTTTRRSGRRTALGFTLVEVMVSAGLGSMVLLGVLSANLQLMRSSVRVTQYAEMATQVRRGLEQLGGDVKSATAIHWNSESDITLTVPTLAGTSTTQVTYAWSRTAQNFYKVPGSDSSAVTGRVTLVTGIPPRGSDAGLTFSRYDRDGNAAASDAATKRIFVLLTVSRSARTAVATSQNNIGASFTMRNKALL